MAGFSRNLPNVHRGPKLDLGPTPEAPGIETRPAIIILRRARAWTPDQVRGDGYWEMSSGGIEIPVSA